MEKEKKAEKMNNRDIDLMKIQICSDRVHATFTTYLSFFFALLVGGLVLALTIRYETIPYAEIISITLMVTFVIFTAVGLSYISQNYTRELKLISKMMETVKEGKELQPLSELEILRTGRNNKLRK